MPQLAQFRLQPRPAVKDRNLFDIVGERYKPLAELGKGAICRVDLAMDIRSKKEIAIKRLHEDNLRNPTALFTLHSEAAALNAVRHPGVPAFIRSSLDVPDPFVAMERIDAQAFSLRSFGTRYEILQSCIAICDILSGLHQLGIVHRDLKPSNILLRTRSRAPVLIDFGFSLVPGLPDLAMMADSPIGTPKFMAPEQTVPKTRMTPQTDIYSLGVIAYSFLSGCYPYTLGPGESDAQIMEAHRKQKAPLMHTVNHRIPVRLSNVMAKAIEKDPRNRFVDAEEMGDALSDCLSLPSFMA
ncbi:MAG: serine/threonine-protein kinase [Candidatus Micrarchaeia archaeon]